MSVAHWIEAARPKTLWATLAPVIMGTAMANAEGGFHFPAAVAALVAGLLIQIGTNFANDYFDFKKGADTVHRLGPRRLTHAGLISPRAMQAAYSLTFGLASLAGVYLIFRGGWLILLIGCLSILSGFLYTGGPFPLGYWGLGNLFALIFFGPVALTGT